jgi:hypothetical protein
MIKKHESILYGAIGYWLIQAVLILFIMGFGLIPLLWSIILSVICILRIIIKSNTYSILFSVILMLYSLVFASFVLLYSIFFYRFHSELYNLAIIIALINLAVSISLFVITRKTISRNTNN